MVKYILMSLAKIKWGKTLTTGVVPHSILPEINDFIYFLYGRYNEQKIHLTLLEIESCFLSCLARNLVIVTTELP
jgi:hypothetical protein